MEDTNTQKSKNQWDETFQLMHWWKPEDVQNAVIMVVGAGALGNEVLKNLALLNVGHILIVDFDTIEYSNLSRSILFRETHQLSSVDPACNVMASSGLEFSSVESLALFQFCAQ